LDDTTTLWRHLHDGKKVSLSSYVIIGTMLFGMFFGSGNLIFPIQMGQLLLARTIGRHLQDF